MLFREFLAAGDAGWISYGTDMAEIYPLND
jgi:hypothetical protein